MLVLNNVQVSLGTNHFNFTCSAAACTTTAILGKSGSGKSTLLNIIAGFILPHTGTITWNETPLQQLPPEQRPVTTLFQQHNLFSHLSVKQNIGLGLKPNLALNRNDLQQIEAVLAEVGMRGYLDRKPTTLSGGEQQRVALARCLLRRQPILLLDEPFSALDTDTREEMLQLTNDVIRNHQLCALIVTHDRGDAIAMNANILQLQDGSLSQIVSE